MRWDVDRNQINAVFAARIDTIPGPWAVQQGERTIAAQDALYAQGRTTPGEIVTQAKGGQSAHNWGLAVDLARITPDGLKWDYDHPDWTALREFVDAAAGMHGGWHFPSPDNDHIQATEWAAKRAQLIASGQWDNL